MTPPPKVMVILKEISFNCATLITHLITIISASQLHFLANRNAELPGRSQ